MKQSKKDEEISVWLAEQDDSAEKDLATELHAELTALRERGFFGWIARIFTGRDLVIARLGANEKLLCEIANQLAYVSGFVQIGHDDMLQEVSELEEKYVHQLEALQDDMARAGVVMAELRADADRYRQASERHEAAAEHYKESLDLLTEEMEKAKPYIEFGKKVAENSWLGDFAAFAKALSENESVAKDTLNNLLRLQAEFRGDLAK